MIGNIYSASVANEATTGTGTLMTVEAPATAVNLVERVYITQSNIDSSENIGSTMQIHSADGTGTANTPHPLMAGQAAYGGTCQTNHTIEPTYTAGGVAWEQGWNLLSGLLWTPATDDEIITCSPSAGYGVNIDVAPAGSTNMSYGMTVREIGT